jgi:hypothetical protein
MRSVQRYCILFITLLQACQTVVPVEDGKGSASDSETQSCAPPGLTPLVCQDFESGITSPVDIVQEGEATLETEQVFAGDASMKAIVSDESSYAEIVETFEPINSGVVYFRVYLYVPVGNTEGTTKILNLSSKDPQVDDVDLGIDINISGQRSLDVYQHGDGNRFKSEDYMLPEGQWVCLKGSYTISDTAGATILWLDDSLALSTTAGLDAVIAGGISEFRVGIGWIGTGQTSSTVYFDNILVATSPVECVD